MTLKLYQPGTRSSKSSMGEAAYQLTKLLEAGFPVPKGFIVAAASCQIFFSHNHLKDKILLLIDRCDFHSLEDIARVSKAIRKLILSSEMPSEISSSLLEAAVKLGRVKVMLTPSPLFADTSSSLTRKFGLSGEATILLSIRELWADLFLPEELLAISSSGEFPSLAICVQVQPKTIVSGVLVTADQDKSACKIQAVWGEGGFVGTFQGADVYTLARGTGEEKDKQRSLQPKEVTFLHGKMQTSSVPLSRQRKQKLPDTALKQLAQLAAKLQQRTYFPQEARFGFDGSKIFLLDLRAATLSQETASETPTPPTSRILLKGLGMTPGIITGKIRIVRGPADTGASPGDILVASKLSHLTNDLLRSAKGVIVEEATPAQTILQLANRGIAFLMNAAGAVDLLEPGSFVTLHTPRGEVLAGGYRSQMIPQTPPIISHTATHIGTSFNLGLSLPIPDEESGSIIMFPDKLIADIGIHPLKLVKERKTKLLSQPLAKAISDLATHHKDRSLMYAFSRLTSDQYRKLSGGREYETENERNPALGYFGSARLLGLPTLLNPEIEALERVRRSIYGRRISLLFPFVRTAFEVQAWHQLLAEKLPRSAGLRYFLDLGVPAMLWQVEKVAPLLDGVVLDLNQIANYLFAADLKSSNFHYQTPDLETSLLGILEATARICRTQGLYLIIKGTFLEHDPYLSFAVHRGVREINVPGQMIGGIKERLLVLEQEHIVHV